MRMRDDTSIKEHKDSFDCLMKKMKTVDLKVDEEGTTMTLFCSFLEHHIGFINNLIFARDILTVEDVKSGLLFEDLRD